MRRRTFRFLTTSAASAVLLGAGLSLAPAADASGGVCTVGDNCSGNVTFDSRSEVFTIHDYNADGHGVYAYIELVGATSTHKVYDGTNNNGYAGKPLVKDLSKDLFNGEEVAYYVCLSEHGRHFDCSNWYDDTV